MSDATLPPGWTYASLGELFTFRGGGTPDKKQLSFWGGDIPWASVKDIKGIHLTETIDSITRDGLSNSASTMAEVGDVIVVTRINPSEAVVSKIRCAINQDLKVIRPPGGMDPEFIRLLFQTLTPRIRSLSSGTTVLGIRLNELSSISIGLPPLAEQKRIVAKIEELFSELETGEENLRAARRQLGVYRQSLLKQAFEGKLTETWRTQNPDKLESPAQLLARIQVACHDFYEQRITNYKLSNSGAKPKKLANISSIELSSPVAQLIPRAWKWFTLNSVSRVLSGFAFKSEDFQKTGVPVIKIANIGYGEFIIKAQEYLSESFVNTAREFVINPGDILIALTRPITNNQTKVCEYPSRNSVALLNQRVAAIKDLCIEKAYFLYFAFSDQFKESIRAKFSETLQPNLSPKDLEQTPIPLCSLPEQQEIVRLLDEQFEAIERNEQEIDAALKRSEALRQAILKKAFTGQLVPQDPCDEPASALLERVQKERISVPPRSPRKRPLKEAQL